MFWLCIGHLISIMDPLIKMFVVYWLIRLHNDQHYQMLKSVLLDVTVQLSVTAFLRAAMEEARTRM